VIGADIRPDKFFPHIQALDQQILVNDKPFTVIGVIQKPIAFSWTTTTGAIQNRAVYVPYESMKKMFPGRKDHFVMAQAEEGGYGSERKRI